MTAALRPAAAQLLDRTAALPVEPRIERLDNGLTLCLLRDPRAPMVVSSLWYRAGTIDEPVGTEGIAHFLEHMMFRGSPGYSEGEVDRITQAQGGSNAAFTTHEATCYQFAFAGDGWREALAIEADRMRALTLEAAAVELERQVILQELAMYEDQAWEALDMAVCARFFGAHPYGRPIVGRRSALETITAAELSDFHRRLYAPDRAVLVLAGDLPESTVAEVAALFDHLAPVGGERSEPRPAEAPAASSRLVLRRGSVDRFLLALPAPAGGQPDHAAAQLLAAVLGAGRASRLHTVLVEERRLSVWLAVDLSETRYGGVLTVALEPADGVPPETVEHALLEELERFGRRPASREELERARHIVVADRVFGSERLEQRATIAGQAMAVFDIDQPRRQLRRLLECRRRDLEEVAERCLVPRRRSVAGWSLAEEPGAGAP